MRPFALAILVSTLLSVGASGAQRVFVASAGNDANPCSRELPCRNFPAALAAVAPGGEVVVLDSAGYGAISITQSVSVIAPSGVYGGITGFAGDAISIDAAGATVVLRGLSLNGLGAASGVNIVNAARMHIEDCVVSNFSNVGLYVANPGALFVNNTTFRGNYHSAVRIAPDTATVTVLIDRSHLDDSVIDNGVYVVPGGGSVKMTIRDSTIAGNGYHGLSVVAPAEVNVQNCTVAYNAHCGISVWAVPSSPTVRLSNTLVTGNRDGGTAGAIISFGNNQVRGNVNADKYDPFTNLPPD